VCNLWSLISRLTHPPIFWKVLGRREGASLFWLPMWFDTLWGDPISKFLLRTFADTSNSVFGPTQSLLQHDDLRRKGRKGGGLELDDLSKGDGQKHTWTNAFINLLQYGLLTKWLSLKWYYNLHVLVLLTLQINWGFCFYSKVVPSPYLSFNFEWWKSTNAVLLIPCQNSNLKWPNVWQLL
jgi:hypothetical protein